MTFIPDNIFNSSYKMGDANISYDKAIAKFGEGDTECDKSSNAWSGSFVASDGTKHRVSFWDWKDGLQFGCGVSVWIHTPKYLDEFIKFIEA